MALQIDAMITPWDSLSDDGKLALVNKIRHNRFVVRENKATTKRAKVAKKTSAKKSEKLKAILAAMSAEERAIFIAKHTGNRNDN